MQPVPLSNIGAGISRLRIKGGADSTTLYDLVNAYVTMQGTIEPKPGTYRVADLSSYTTIGLVGYQGTFYVFSHEFQDVPPGFTLRVLRHPAGSSAATSSGEAQDTLIIPLKAIHFAAPFMGFLYVVAEFVDDGGSGLGTVFHYWCQTASTWDANTDYCIGDVVTPTTPNGFFYVANRISSPNPQWQPDTPYAEGDIVEPSTPNCFEYVCVETEGTSPESGSTEPDWPVVEGGQVFEITNDATGATIITSSSTPAGQPSVGQTVPTNVMSPYANLYSGYQDPVTIPAQGPSVSTAAQPNVNSGLQPWQPAHLYLPGDAVLPTNQNVITTQQPYDNTFESLSGWTLTSEYGTGNFTLNDSLAYSGPGSAYFTGADGTGPNDSVWAIAENNYLAPVTPGQTITFQCYVARNTAPSNASYCNGGCYIQWLNESNEVIGVSLAQATNGGAPTDNTGVSPSLVPPGMAGGVSAGAWTLNKGTGTAPTGAAYAQFCIVATGNTVSGPYVAISDCTWNYAYKGYPSGLMFIAVQADPGLSGTVEPTWPTEATSETITDNQVTWEAEYASRIVWQAQSILVSGDDEPTWPTEVGTSVNDNNSISWVASDGRVTDSNCPNTTGVTIGASKVFAVNDDIVSFSATSNPLDWTSSNDAGYLPTGMQNYGSEPALGLGLYRSNLLVFNSLGYQMWQIDPDPTNMAYLDGEPVGSIYFRAGQPVNDDYVLLSPVGVRSIGFSGQAGNLQAGEFGKQVDPLVLSLLNSMPTTFDANGVTVDGIPIGLFYSGTGQYWLIFNQPSGGAVVMVLTMNANQGSQITGPNQSWSRYTFPDNLTDWTVLDGVLYVKSAGNLVWMVDSSAIQDDTYCDPTAPVLTGSLTYAATGTAVLTWTAAESADESPIAGYNVYSASGPTLEGETADLTFDVGSLTDFTTYNFYVQAFTNAGGVEQSNTVELTTGGPQPPTTVTATIGNDSSPYTVTLDWSGATTTGSNIAGFKIYDASTGDLLYTDANPDASSYEINSDWSGGGSLSYYITTYTETAESSPSATVTVSLDSITYIFTSSQSWTNPGSGTATITVIGGGASGASGYSLGTWGGGGGGFTQVDDVDLADLTSTINVTVGAGGVVTASVDGTYVSWGGASWFGGSADSMTGYYVLAYGAPGTSNGGSQEPGDTGYSGGSGGYYSVGTLVYGETGGAGDTTGDGGGAGSNGAPGGGGRGLYDSGGSPGQSDGGAGSGDYGGAGGNGGLENEPGTAGQNYGGGGGGGGYSSNPDNAYAGGAGAQGVIVVTIST